MEFFFLWQKVLGTQLYAFRDGYSSFPRAAGGRLRRATRRPVKEVIETDDGVQLTYEDADGEHTETGAGAVVSSMGNVVPDLVPQLAPERAQFLRDLNYTSCIINLALSRPPAEKAAFVVVPRPVSEKAVRDHRRAQQGARAGARRARASVAVLR